MNTSKTKWLRRLLSAFLQSGGVLMKHLSNQNNSPGRNLSLCQQQHRNSLPRWPTDHEPG